MSDKLLAFRIPDDMRDEIDRLALTIGESRSAVARRAIQCGLHHVARQALEDTERRMRSLAGLIGKQA